VFSECVRVGRGGRDGVELVGARVESVHHLVPVLDDRQHLRRLQLLRCQGRLQPDITSTS